MLRRSAPFATTLLASACMQGPAFMTQSGEEVPPPQGLVDPVEIYVSVTEDGGKTTGLVAADELAKTQIVRASDKSPVAGTQAAFPPGSLGIDTAVTIGPGESLATDDTLSKLELDFVLSSAEAIEIASSVPLDAQGPFTLQIPLPSGGSGLVDQDAYANLVVLYRIKKVAEDKEFEGILPRRNLAIKDGFVVFQTLHFGTYQAVITQTLIASHKEVEKDAPVTSDPRSLLYYVKGFRALSTGGGVQHQEGITAWMGAFAPSRVGSSKTMTTGYVVRQKDEE